MRSDLQVVCATWTMFFIWPASPGCARVGAASSRGTRKTTSWPRSCCSKPPRSKLGKFVYASTSSVYGDTTRPAHARRWRHPARVALWRQQTGRRTSLPSLLESLRRAHGGAALLYGLRTAAAARYVFSYFHARACCAAKRFRSTMTASRPAILHFAPILSTVCSLRRIIPGQGKFSISAAARK